MDDIDRYKRSREADCEVIIHFEDYTPININRAEPSNNSFNCINKGIQALDDVLESIEVPYEDFE